MTQVQDVSVLPEKFAGAEGVLQEIASQRTGLSDFGDENQYLPGLKVLLQSLNEEQGRFTAMGCHFAFEVLTETLCSRLMAVKGWKQYPECLDRPIKAPIIIVGLPRTGTTALFHLLSLDSQFQVPERWLIESPMPRPPRAEWPSYPAFQRCVKSIDQLAEIAPHFLAVHQRGADLADECLDITSQCFSTNLWGTMFSVPEYDRWWQDQGHGSEYQYLKQVLQLIGFRDDRRWLLKDPSTLLYLDVLKAVFPDISVIVTHRDPMEALPSVCSLISAPRKIMMGTDYDLKEIGSREIAIWSNAANKLRPSQVPYFGRRADVYFSDFLSQPMTVIVEIYTQLGLTLSSEAEQAMLDYIQGNGQNSDQPHHYTLDKFGLNPDEIRSRFSPYVDAFQPFTADEKR
jgi:Sulfotransferase family